MRGNNGLGRSLTVDAITREFDLLHYRDGIVRVPFLVKGRLVSPPPFSRAQAEAAFHDYNNNTTYLKLPEGQIIREPVIDRTTMKYNGEYVYQVLPPVSGVELIETDIDRLVRDLYSLPVEGVLDYLDSVAAVLEQGRSLLAAVLEISRMTAEYPDDLLTGWFTSLGSAFSREAARRMIDNELSFWGRPGSEFLTGWVEAPVYAVSGTPPPRPRVRAMPTRQLHITAGNAPEVPVISLLRAILTKSSAVIKLPLGATITGSLLALAAVAAAPDHPLTRNLSLVYWPGGDESIEKPLFQPGAFDRIVVWGSLETVASVQQRALFIRTVFLNPRYGVSLIGREAFSNIEEVVAGAVTDSLIYNQKACTSSLVHYVEGTETQVNSYAESLQRVLQERDSAGPRFVSPSARGQVKRLRRGRYAGERWYTNRREGVFTSGVVVVDGEFDITEHPACRLIVVQRVDNLSDTLKYLHQGVSTVGIYPEARRTELIDLVVARGVSNVLPLGRCGDVYPGMPQDGMMVLRELVDWKNG
jgi:hypothetical protein